MRFDKLMSGMLLVLAPTSQAAAQTVPDDVRCFLLSNVFAKSSADERARQAAAQSVLFYVGRLDGRASRETVASALRAQRGAVNAGAASAEMNACAARMQRTQQMIQAAINTVAPKKP